MTGSRALRLIENGYSPIPIPRGKKGCFVKNWTRFCETQPDVAEIEQWVKADPDCGWGLACGHVVAIDIDELDERRAEEMQARAFSVFGPTELIRYGNRPKRVLLYRADERIRSASGPSIDILADGKQVVAFHIHPVTRKPYEWPDKSPLDVPRSTLPVINQNQVDAFLSAFPRPDANGGTRGDLSLIVWGDDGRAVEGREALLFRIVRDVWYELGCPNSSDSTDEIARASWVRFEEQANLSRPKGTGSRPYAPRDAYQKAKWRVKNGAAEKRSVPPAFPSTEEPDAVLAAHRLRAAVEAHFVQAANFREAQRDLDERILTKRFALEDAYWRLEGVPDVVGEYLPLPDDEKQKIDRQIASLKPAICESVRVAHGVSDLDHAPRVQIRAVAGIGKTQEVIRALARNKEWVCHYYVPTTALALEILPRLRAEGINAEAILGRDNQNTSAPLCEKATAARIAGELGLNVFRALCRRKSRDGEVHICSNFDTCPYLNQFDQNRTQVYVLAHEFLYLPPPGRLPKPDLVIVDENVILRLAGHCEFAPDRLPKDIQDAVQRHISEGISLKDALLSAGITRKTAQEQIRSLSGEIEHDVLPTMSEREALAHLEAVRGAERPKVRHFLERVVAEIGLDRDLHGIVVKKDMPTNVNGQQEHQHRVFVHWPREVRISNKTPVLLIDADADIELNRRFFGKCLENIYISAKRHAHVVQCRSTRLSKMALAGKGGVETVSMRKVRMVIEREKKNASRILVVINKPIRERLTDEYAPTERATMWNGVTVTHFGAIRGCDDWKDFDTVIIVGREQPPPLAVDDLCRAIFADDRILLTFSNGNYIEAPRGYRMIDGRHTGVKAHVHPDPRGQKILELIRERESTQAVDRLRLVHTRKKKRVVILSNLPLDITVDELRSLDQLAGNIDRMAEDKFRIAMEREGMVPLGPRDLYVAFPDLWKSVHAAGHAVEKYPTTSNNNLFEKVPHLTTAVYRRPGQRGKASKVVFDPARHPDPELSLQRLLGVEIHGFEIELTAEQVDAIADSDGECLNQIHNSTNRSSY